MIFVVYMQYWQEDFKQIIEEITPNYTKKVEAVYKFSDGKPIIQDLSTIIITKGSATKDATQRPR